METKNAEQKRRRGRPKKQQAAPVSVADNQQEQDGQSPSEQQEPSQEAQSGPMKMQVNIYRALPFIFPKIKVVALSAIMGKANSWVNNRLTHVARPGKQAYCFHEGDLPIVNDGLYRMGQAIMQSLIEYSEDRDELNRQVKQLAKLVPMAYIYHDNMKKSEDWYKDRLRPTKPKYNMTFTKLDIMCFNYMARQIAAELMSVEMVL